MKSFSACFVVFAATVSVQGAERSAQFGREWVRSHPLTLMALVQRNEAVSDNDLYAGCGLNTLLAWKDRAGVFEAAARQGIPWHYQLDSRRGPLSDAVKQHLAEIIETRPGGEGVMLWDEPKLPEMDALGEVAEWIKQTYPDLLVYTTGNPVSPVGDHRYLPHLAGVLAATVDGDPEATRRSQEALKTYPYSYNDYLRDMIHRAKTDILMADVYPFWMPEKLDPEDYLIKKYFLMLSLMRQEALKAGLPYWIFVQAYEHPARCRFPSESDVRMQVYSSLAYGFTGIAYFTFDATFDRAILDTGFHPTPLHEQIRDLNDEVQRLGQSLRFLTSTEVVYVPGRSASGGETMLNPVPVGISAMDSRSLAATIISQLVIHDADGKTNLLLGSFKDDDGGRYLMIVNLTHGENLSAKDTEAACSITLTPAVRQLTRLSRTTGKAERVEMDGSRIEITLPGGTGELFKINNDQFAGLAATP